MIYNGKVLFTKREGLDDWRLPGGTVGKWEIVLQATIWEVPGMNIAISIIVIMDH